MNVEIILQDKANGYYDSVLVENIGDKKDIEYIDNSGAKCHLLIDEKTICLKRKEKDHLTNIFFKEDGYIEIITSEGILKFILKIVEFKINNDMISIVYNIDDSEKNFLIKYI